MTTAVIGREQELAAIEAFLAEAEQGPRALVFSGEPGIGKTTLWEQGVEEARSRVGRTLSHRSVEPEALLSFAGLTDLLADVLEEVAPALLPLRREALEIALLLVKPGEVAPDPRVIGLAFLDVLRLLAEAGPVVLALDDVQWLDSSSLAVLQIALRRLRGERVGFLATAREAPEVRDGLELERCFAEEQLTRLPLDPLSLGALHHLLRERLALELTRPELVRVQETSGGNPFFALELGRELVRTGARPAAGRGLRVPESLHDLLGGGLARLPEETNDVLLSAAALARPTIELVVAAQGDRAGVLEALDAAVREGVVELDDSRVRFAHSMLASICYEQAPLQKRRAVHRTLAAVVTDLEERARHLALSADSPDAVVASYLEVAAAAAAARGATAAAAELCELAAELTPADPPLARRRRLRAATFHRFAGDGERAVAILEQLLLEIPSGVDRADVLFELASTFGPGIPALVDLYDEALVEAEGDDARSARILGLRSVVRLNEANISAALADARAALEKAERTGDPTLLAVAIGHAGHAETWAAEITPGLLERGAEIEERLGLELDFRESPRLLLARLLLRLGEIERPRTILQEWEAKAATRGDEVTRVVVIWYLASLEWLAGNWQRALDHAVAAHELAELTQFSSALVWVGRVKALVETDLGLVEQARASADEGLAVSRATANEAFIVLTLGVLGRLELALGNLDKAAGYLREVPGRLLAGGLNDPAQPVWADAIETLIGFGELEQARVYLEQYEANARRLGSPAAIACTTRCRGLLCAAEHDVPAALAALERALSEQPEPGWPLERGRTLLCLGMVRRQAQQKKAAREALEGALVIFEELGARLWAEKARAELKRISGRTPASDELTETERRVAELAASGRSNKEIAAELYMGVSTVEAHLSRVYRKLGIRSRTELAGRIAIPRDEAAQL